MCVHFQMESQINTITFMELIEMPLFNLLQSIKSINQTNDIASRYILYIP